MENILIIQEVIPHYRIPLFNEIVKEKKINLTVTFDLKKKKPLTNAIKFGIVGYEKRILRNLVLIKNLRRLVGNADRVVIVGDLHFLPTFLYLLFFSRCKVYFWGIGVSSTGGIHKKPLIDKIRFALSDLSSGTILYSKEIADYYLEHVKKKKQVFALPNTLYVEKFPFLAETRTKIVSMGSFNKVKRLDHLIKAFHQISKIIPPYVTLEFIGDGQEEQNLKQLVNDLGLQNKVIFWGRIEQNKQIYPILSSAMVCVSPTQAGLSVLHSMAFGCPFLTSFNSVTGGEMYNIIDNVNGYFYNGTIEELSAKLLWIVNNKENLKVCQNAYEYYHSNRTIYQYAQSFLDILSD